MVNSEAKLIGPSVSLLLYCLSYYERRASVGRSRIQQKNINRGFGLLPKGFSEKDWKLHGNNAFAALRTSDIILAEGLFTLNYRRHCVCT